MNMQSEITVTALDDGKAFNQFKSWGSPGRDNIQANWWESSTSIHGKPTEFYDNMTKNPDGL